MAHWLSKILFKLPPESAHDLAKFGARMLPGNFFSFGKNISDSRLITPIGDLKLANPIGLAAGFDKTGESAKFLSHLGFGHLELGSITAKPCPGNPKPRLFRLQNDLSLINRLGLPGPGANHFAKTFKKISSATPLFINIAKTPEFAGGPKDIEGGIADYLESFSQLAPLTKVITLNLSCPNSGDGKFFEHPELLEPLLKAIAVKKSALRHPPLILAKLSPDQNSTDLKMTLEILQKYGIDGAVLTNTTTSRNQLKTPKATVQKIGAGGLSGAALTSLSLETMRLAREISGRNFLLVGVGGIMNFADALQRLVAGADLLQVYTGFVYGGPLFARELARQLSLFLDHHKIADLSELSGNWSLLKLANSKN